MSYRMDDKIISINRKKLHKISSDSTGDVYCYRNQALKLFKQGEKPPIEEETARYLTGISTSRVLLPKNLVFSNNAFKGFTYKLVNKPTNPERLIQIERKQLVEEISVIERDIEILSNKNVLLSGIDPKNAIHSHELYLSAPDQFSILDLYSNRELELLNKYQLHLLMTALLISDLRKSRISKRKEETIKELLSMKEESDHTSEFLEDLMSSCENFEQFVKKIK